MALTAKQALLHFLDKHGLRSGLSISIESGPPPPAPSSFVCTASVPIFDPKAGGFTAKQFFGQASTKKHAEHAAARSALDHIDAQGLLPEALKITVPVAKQTSGSALASLPAQKPDVATAAAAPPAANSGIPGLEVQVNNEPVPTPPLSAPPVEPVQKPEVQAQHTTLLAAGQPQALPQAMRSEPKQEGADLNNAEFTGIRMPWVPMGLESEVEQQLGNRKLVDLTPLELKEELQKALDRNTELKNAIHHEEQRREKAVSILLGLS